MLIHTHKYERGKLRPLELDFFSKVVPLGMLISEWTVGKAEFLRVKSPRGMFASLIIAEIFVNSFAGQHPISKDEFNKKFSNNLSLIEVDKYWKGKSHNYGPKSFKAYREWSDFALDYSDIVCVDTRYRALLQTDSLEQQIQELSLTNAIDPLYNEKLKKVINSLGLEDFDF